MAGRFCQQCGAPNDAAATKCAACGAELKWGIPPGAPAAPAAAPMPPPGPPTFGPPVYGPPPMYGPPYAYPAYIPDYAALENQRQVGWTKYGVLVLAVAMAISWLPVTGLACLTVILFLIGLILMGIGRKAFGDRHAKFVIASIVLIVLSIVLLVIITIWFAVAVVAAAYSGDLSGVAGMFWGYLAGGVVVSLLEGMAFVLFTHELENRLGRYLLYASFAVFVVLQVGVFLWLMPEINALLVALQSGTLMDPNDPRILALEAMSGTLSLVSAIPYVMFAGAYLLAYLRIQRKEIPAPSQAPPAWSPFPPPVQPAGAPPSAPATPPARPPAQPPSGPPGASPP